MAVSGAPATHADLVRDFVNTLDVQAGEDRLDSPAALAAWLRERGLAADRRPADGDLERALALREGLRAALRDHHDDDHHDDHAPAAPGPRQDRLGRLDQLLAGFPLRISMRTGTPGLEPAGSGTGAGLAGIVAAVAQSHADRTWTRLKVCADPSCEWAFLDTSRNQSRSWCSMQACGNRAKTKAYRARQTGQPAQAAQPARAARSDQIVS